MSGTLALTALLMGLAGGPHCAAMCGPACSGVIRVVRPGASSATPALWQFQAGRLIGYSLAGALAAQAVESLAWLTAQAAALRPVWTLFHLAVLLWGATLLVLARQPSFAGPVGRAVWARARPVAAARGGAFTAGVLWALMPCGLLYSALLVASLSGTAADGALAMGLFAIGSGVSLAIVPGVLERLRGRGDGRMQEWAMRVSGLLLVLAAGWSLWLDLSHRIAAWCGITA
ncbi:sulfite exporter TauE/SafE family protein [Caenimonas aquaedulcis]|uniref:Sulfite exporter TauE/SafE family protein n=1 Tax=Caenimonas aquaedulcis TaxID=2793270 RepID=A0A931MIU1_9BURK|nr:sulfite exporter TauE/SafE family protein [Caenimonas aquaedulcis]MBG9390199.1 sulfite exporter TauE/SafE family protein [Caenimonas aquaedulcis]